MSARRVVIAPGIRAAMVAQLTTSPDLETGGILMGLTHADGTVQVTAASPPGPHAVRRPRFFRRDTAFLQRWLTRRWRQSGHREEYVGEWHVHHAIGVPPSPVDRRELHKIARRANYPTE